MSESTPGPGWWQASNGGWYPPESHPAARQDAPTVQGGIAPEPGSQPPASWWSAGKIVALVIGALVAVAIAAVVVLGLVIDRSASNASVDACKTERATLITASMAAKTSNKVSNNAETWRDYVDSDFLAYFEESASGFDRTTLDEVPEDDCGTIGPTELGE